MSSNKVPTFEEVDKHIQSADMSVFQAGGASRPASAKGAAKGGAASAALSTSQVCAAYQVVKPILQLVANLPIIPKKWKDAIKAFMGVLDMLCP
jgi:hypothetical protein